jgi:hypothetical protein
MSLINEALKKAQRSRHPEGPLPAGDLAGASGPIAKRGEPKSAKSTLYIAVGAVVLIVISMVITAWWMSRPAKPATVAVAAKSVKPATAPAVTSEPTAPLLVVPDLKPTPPTAAEPPKPTPMPASARSGAAETHAPASVNRASAPAAQPETPAPVAANAASSNPPAAPSTPDAGSAPASVAAASPARAPAESAPTAKPDERISQFVEGLHVMGIRASGGDSKVLMNDRVYRVNDIVDRTLGVRLTKVSSDHLTFTDANGATYQKYF